MVYRGSRPRETKRLIAKSQSTSESKWKRHRNKKRIWRRAVRKFEIEMRLDATHTIELPASALPV
jgi:hypothetical protein